MKLKLLRCHNMIPPHKWCVEEDRLVFPATLFFGTRKQCEEFIRTHENPDILEGQAQ